MLFPTTKKLHQKVLSEVYSKAKSMRLMFKPSKCWSLSICAGKPTDVTFVLTDSEDSPSQAQHKFLGSLVTITCNSQDYY